MDHKGVCSRVIFLIFLMHVTSIAAAQYATELKQGPAGSPEGQAAIGQPVFFPSRCKKVCRTGSDFHVPLPTAPNLAVGNVASQWGTALLDQIRQAVVAGKTSPPAVGHTLAVYSTAVYDAVALLSHNMRPVHATPDARHPNAAASKSGVEAAIAGAAYTAITTLFPSATGLEPLMGRVGTSLAQQAAYVTGAAAARQVLAARAQDGFGAPVAPPAFPNPPMTTTVTTTCSVTDINNYQQLKVPTVKAFTPGPGAVFPPAAYSTVATKTQGFLGYAAASAKPFCAFTAADIVGNALSGPNLLTGPRPQAQQFMAEMDQVLSLSASLDDVNKTIAEFWADGPDSTFPPGHWYHIALEQVELRGLNLHKTVVLLMAVGNALQDAGIAAWYAKATWLSSRPITALQCLYQGQQVTAWRGPYLGIGARDGSTWQPYQPIDFVTPPFPGYISGHSTFSAAAARVLTRFFRNAKYKVASCYRAEPGSSVIEPRIDRGQQGYAAGYTDVPSVNGGPGYTPGRPVVLCWDSFQDAAAQSGISRLHGGIHVSKDNLYGRLMGDIVGNRVMDMVHAHAPTLCD